MIQGIKILQVNNQNVFYHFLFLLLLLFSECFYLYLRKPTAAKSPVLHRIWAEKKIEKFLGKSLEFFTCRLLWTPMFRELRVHVAVLKGLSVIAPGQEMSSKPFRNTEEYM